ncbi:transcription factor domain-containing protein [Aspergillus saccharolyticus JOP 1030-1]|uniref:Zn(2)-C6 fungal-type domain-containing protein n=1 Tax=Aspergillus saccharolyticus JOP 1030-1 TaxID=1450539 RepID=A0A318Z5A2_9EURO|nr:hypothetical protein BP01DRAFT_347085 [Aspergillus saccharolyticus JOP 1030-1]PYH42286.1 hypothetical protein BP01DRAFT_347085 [Aspergillus saccharolyticus JOP 1030-1]
MTSPSPSRRPSSPPDSAISRKRRRQKGPKAAVACDACRARHIRCDGIHPECGQCRRTRRRKPETQCVFTGDRKLAMDNFIKSIINNVETFTNYKRVSEDTSQLNGTGSQVSAGPQTQSPNTSQTPKSIAVDHPSTSQLGSRLTGSIPEARNDSSSPCLIREQSPEAASICTHKDPLRQRMTLEFQHPAREPNGVNAMMGEVEEERPTHGFFGSSSAAGFIRQIKTAIDQRVQSPYHRTTQSNLGAALSSSVTFSRNKPPSSSANYVLPPRKMADSLMEVYWTFVFPLYPLVDSLNLRAEYARLWTGESSHSDENLLMCTFNVIFALACQLADFIPPEEREASADAFFSRAKELLQFNLWNTGSAELIQCLLLMAQYLQSTDSAHQCWIVTGLAIRNAQSLGLHLPQTSARLHNPQEKQLARKIWHGCVLMDRVISMTFGRPSMISKASCGSVPLPATVDEEYIPSALGTDAAQPADRPSVMAFYAQSLELYEILNDILLSMYNPNPDESPDDVYFKDTTEGKQTVFELDRALTNWSRNLPPHLRGDASLAYGDKMFYHQSIVLQARFLHVRMLLFRPILSKYCTARDVGASDPGPLIAQQDSLTQRIALQCSVICVKVAQEIIGLIYRHIPADGTAGPLPAWWYNILYIYTAATTLIASHLCPAIISEITSEAITNSWNHALEILRNYHRYSTSARRCVAALEILYERVVAHSSSGADDAEQPGPSFPVAAPAASTGLGVALGETLGGPLGEESGLFEEVDFWDGQLLDMSWLNSVPSHLF